MTSNKFRDRIRLESPGAGRDPVYGRPLLASWVPFQEVWAEIQDIAPSKSESNEGSIRLAKDSTRIRIRHLPGVLPTMRVVEVTGAMRTLTIIGGPAAIFGGREIEVVAERFSS